MTDINKTKFLAELGRLLTFMHSEDRKTALDMYDKLFAETVDEQALLQMQPADVRQSMSCKATEKVCTCYTTEAVLALLKSMY